MKVIVFGGAGFIGSHVADRLSEEGHDVQIFDIRKSPYLKSNQKMIVGDILDKDAVTRAVAGCDYVYNFAGIADLDDACKRPLDTINHNILGNAIILDAAVRADAKRFVYSSTIYVYSECGGFYRCSKQAAELYIEEFAKSKGLNYTILRFGTVYGTRADERNSMYRYIKQAMDTGKIVCYGSGDELREYVNVKDVAKACVDILSDEFTNKHIILTGHNPMRFKDMLSTIREILGNKIDIEYRSVSRNSKHYNLTPYSFNPKIGEKYFGRSYIDLGQGILECLHELHDKSQCADAISDAKAEAGAVAEASCDSKAERSEAKPYATSPIKAIIFDFDGVILDSANIKTEAFRELFKDFPQCEDIIKYHIDNSGISRYKKFEHAYQNILNLPFDEEKSQELGRKFSELVLKKILACPFILGAENFLNEYSRKIPLFIASGTPQEELEHTLQGRRISNHFASVHGTPATKPEIIKKILSENNLAKNEVIFVGDAMSDYRAAAETSIPFVGLISGEENPFSGLNVPTIYNFAGLKELLTSDYFKNGT